MSERNTRIEGIDIHSTDARRASTDDSCCDILIEPEDTAFNFLSRPEIKNVLCFGSPWDGVILGGGAAELGEFDLVTVSECGRHPFIIGDGTGGDRVNIDLNAFYINLRRCRAIRCGGNVLIGQENDSGVPAVVILDRMEILSCAHSTKRVSDYQLVDRGRKTVIRDLDIEDQEYASTEMFSGNTKVARAAPSKGVLVYSKDTAIEGLYASSLSEYVRFASTASGFNLERAIMFKGTYDTPHSSGVTVESGAYGGKISLNTAHIDGITSGVNPVTNNEATTEIVIDGVPYFSGSSNIGSFPLDGVYKDAKIVSGKITYPTSAHITVLERDGQDVDSDSLARIDADASCDGLVINLQAETGLTLTLRHSLGVSGTAKPLFLGGSDIIISGSDIATLEYSNEESAWSLVSLVKGGIAQAFKLSTQSAPTQLSSADLPGVEAKVNEIITKLTSAQVFE